MDALLNGQALIREEWNKQYWGNNQAAIHFLECTGLLTEPRKLLEVGSGKGYMLRHLRNAGHDVQGVEANPAAIAECDKDLVVQQVQATTLPFADATFDIVLSLDVFEHIPDSDAHLMEVRRVLKPNGHYLLQTPNKWTNIPFELLRWSRKHGIRDAFGFLKPPEHCALHTFGQLGRRLRSNGFSAKFYDIPVVNEFFIDKVKRYLGNAGVATLKVVNPDKLPLSMRTNFFVEAQRLDAVPARG